MKSFVKNIYNNSRLGFTLLKPFVSIYQYFLHKKYLSREQFILKRFKKNFGHELNLKNPKSLNEKINWLILNNDNPLGSLLADKYRVREYIKSEIGEKYLVPLAYMTKDPKDIIPENLPDYPVIIKTNHNSSGGIVIKDKNKTIDWKSIQNRLRANLAENFYWVGRELVYKDIQPLIIVEKLLNDNSGSFPADYKVHCFNGKVEMTAVVTGRGSNQQHCDWYNREWIRQPYEWGVLLEDGSYSKASEKGVKKPICYDKMLELSETLSSKFKYLRVDWYVINDNLFFGELTLYHQSGSKPVKPYEWDLKLGEKLTL
jgi:hypothetical protein